MRGIITTIVIALVTPIHVVVWIVLLCYFNNCVVLQSNDYCVVIEVKTNNLGIKLKSLNNSITLIPNHSTCPLETQQIIEEFQTTHFLK